MPHLLSFQIHIQSNIHLPSTFTIYLSNAKMKFITLLGLAATALAMPYGELPWDDLICTPPEYICKPDFTGWLVCNVDGHYLVSPTSCVLYNSRESPSDDYLLTGWWKLRWGHVVRVHQRPAVLRLSIDDAVRDDREGGIGGKSLSYYYVD